MRNIEVECNITIFSPYPQCGKSFLLPGPTPCLRLRFIRFSGPGLWYLCYATDVSCSPGFVCLFLVTLHGPGYGYVYVYVRTFWYVHGHGPLVLVTLHTFIVTSCSPVSGAGVVHVQVTFTVSWLRLRYLHPCIHYTFTRLLPRFTLLTFMPHFSTYLIR